MFVQRIAQNMGHALESIARESAADIQRFEVEADSSGLVEDVAGILHGLGERLRIGSSRPDVKAHAYHIQIEVFGELQKVVRAVQGCTEFQTEPAEAGGIVCQNAQEELGIGEMGFGFVKLICVIECHLLDALRGCIAHIGFGLAWLGVDDAGRIHAQREDLFDLGLGRTVKTGA